MKDLVDNAAPQDTDALIAHALSRYHEVHRSDLTALHPLAQKVEKIRAEGARGLAWALLTLWREVEARMAKVERVLFPAMRAEHEDRAANITHIRALTADLCPPDHACGSCRAPYTGTGKLSDDLAMHFTLEITVLFPRFERG